MQKAGYALQGVGRIPLHGRGGTVTGWTTVDLADLPGLTCVRWSRQGRYVGRRVSRPQRVLELMHRRIMGLADDDPHEVDHINRNKFDNRRANLRLATRGQNAQNVTKRAGTTSAYRGVSWNTRKSKWVAMIKVDGRAMWLGYHVEEEEAARVARAARERYFPFATD